MPRRKTRKLPAASMPQPGVEIRPTGNAVHKSHLLLNDSIRESLMRMAREGHTDRQMAEAIGVNEKTFLLWRSKYKDFGAALLAAKDIADDLVEATLYQKAVGYSHAAVKIFFDAKSLQTIEHKYTEIYPPDTTAAIFWLKNRRPKAWREKIEVSTENVETMSDDQIVAALNEYLGSKNK